MLLPLFIVHQSVVVCTENHFHLFISISESVISIWYIGQADHGDCRRRQRKRRKTSDRSVCSHLYGLLFFGASLVIKLPIYDNDFMSFFPFHIALCATATRVGVGQQVFFDSIYTAFSHGYSSPWASSICVTRCVKKYFTAFALACHPPRYSPYCKHFAVQSPHYLLLVCVLPYGLCAVRAYCKWMHKWKVKTAVPWFLRLTNSIKWNHKKSILPNI